MRGFFEPESVAVIGVSDRPGNLARAIVLNLQAFGFAGQIQLVGPRGGSFGGLPIHLSVEALPEPADLGVVLAPAATVPALVEACGRAGIRRLVIESAGFGEKGGEGIALQRALQAAARRHGVRFIGPNCLGVMSMREGLIVPFSPLSDIYPRGGISVLSQSGGVGVAYLSLLAHEGLGLARFASIGNKLDVDECDLLEFLLADERTTHVVMYLEGLGDGRRLLRLLEGARKPVLVQKANRGVLSRAIAASHTASLAGDDRVIDAALAQVGALRFDDGASLVNGLKALSLPPLPGSRLAVISRSGGHAVQVADACEAAGFSLAALEASLLGAIRERSRAGVVRLTNPLDLGDLFDFDAYVELVAGALAQDDVDGVVFLHTYTGTGEQIVSRRLVARLAALGRESTKPLAVVIVADPAEQAELRRTAGFPLFAEPTEAVAALATLRDHSRPRPVVAAEAAPEVGDAQAVLAPCLAERRDPRVDEAIALVAAAGLPVVPGRVVPGVGAAMRAGRELGLPAAAKLVASAASHKSDVGGVRLGLGSQAALRAAARDLLAVGRSLGAERPGVLVQPMAPEGVDLILGARRDPQLGTVALVGFGGIFVELLDQVALRVAPLSRAQARDMILGLRGSGMLTGARGRAALDVDAAAEALVRLAALLDVAPPIQEIEVNPFRVLPSGGLALDARVILG
ncbi:MAG: acetate--CoA ligase family protein [Pseudomonadota bacterium]